MKDYSGLEIAIIGMAGRFPGAADLQAFWNNLANGVESISFFTDEELIEAGVDKSLVDDYRYVKANGLLENKDCFDSAFFNYRPDEARLMEPQMRIFHECVWAALEDAGWNPDDKNKIGLFAGAATNINWEIYAHLINRKGYVDDFSVSLLSSPRFIPTKISYNLNLKGPSLFLDTACSTSLVAVHQACKSLLMGECNMVVAGGIHVTGKFRAGYMYEEGMIHSKDGHCRTFDDAASGTVGSEGVGVIVLKTLKNALRDRDHIWAIIKGSGINNDGSDKVGYTAPSIHGQVEAILMAQKWAKVEPESISYIEAHGTATRLGDPVEVEALANVFGYSTEKYCALGSVKSNIGHLDGAAGIAGLIKTVLALKNRKIPPSLHFETPNREIDFANTPFYVNTVLRDWRNDNYPLRAGVSSFGIGGTNAHVILEEAPGQPPAPEGRKYQTLLLSAKTPAALQRVTDEFCNYLENSIDADLPDVAYTLQTGRRPFPYRRYVVCRDGREAISQLRSDTAINIDEPITDKLKYRKVFMFSGQGSQYINMCYDLYTHEPAFKEEADRCLEIIKDRSGKDLLPVLFNIGGGDPNHINNTEYTQPLLFVVEYALTRVLMKWGIMPDMMIGHSIGEYVAACISGVFSLEDALWLVIKRGELMQSAPEGIMLSVSMSQDMAKTLLTDYQSISLAAVNSSSLCVVSGAEEDIHTFKKMLDREGYENRILRTSHAFHSNMMDVILPAFEEAVKMVAIHPMKIPFMSNLTGDWAVDAEISSPGYWVDHLRRTVLFSDGIRNILKDQHVIFIEVGPGRSLCSMVRSNQKRTKAHKVCQLIRNANEEANDQQYLLTGLGRLWLHGTTPDWDAMNQKGSRRKLSLPSYPFEKKRYPVYVDGFRMLSDIAIEDYLQKGPDHSVDNSEHDGFPGNEISYEISGLEHAPSAGPDAVVKTMLALWQDFFGRPDIVSGDDFFEIGGDSLKALTMIGRIHKIFNVEIPTREFFSNSSVERLSLLIDNIQSETTGGKQYAQYQAIPRSPVQSSYPLSSTQRRLYFLYEFDKYSLAYNLPQAINIKGPVNTEKFSRIINLIVGRHEILRTYVDTSGEAPVQRIAGQINIPMECFNAAEDQVPMILREFIRPFDLNNGPLIRTGLIKVARDEHVFMIDMHHFISDAISFNIFLKEFMTLYKGDDPGEVPLQYRDYALWQTSPIYQQALARERDWWLQEFREEVVRLDLPLDHSRPLVRNYAGDTVRFLLDETEMSILRKIADAEGATAFMVLLSIYSILLGRLSGQEDVVVGTPTSGRNHADLERILGMFVNTVPIRTNPNGALSYRNYLRQLKSKILTAFDQQAYPYELLIEEVKVARDTSRNPLFDVWFSYENWEIENFELAELDITPCQSGPAISQFDLSLTAGEWNGSMRLNFEYSTELFEKTTIERFITYFRAVISAVGHEMDRTLASISLVMGEEKELLIHGFNDTVKPIEREKTFFELFAEQAARTPHHIAVRHNKEELAYRDLYQRAMGLSHYLTSHGIGAGSRVALYMPRGIDMLTAIMGIFAAGGAYVPIETDYPVQRVTEILEDSEAPIVLVNGTTAFAAEQIRRSVNSLKEVAVVHTVSQGDYPEAGLQYRAGAQDIAYIIYTSGTTGKPKGAMVHQLGMLNHMYGMIDAMQLNARDVLGQTASCSFDISVWQLLCALLIGGTTCIIDKEKMLDAGQLLIEMYENKVTVAEMVPTVLRTLLDEALATRPEMLHSLRWMIPTAEQISMALVTKWYNTYPQIPLINAYGPAEASDDVTLYRINKDIKSTIIPIGKPIGNIRIYILDKYLNLCPVGVCGEICIAGVGVGKGYWKDPAKTARVFVPNPFAEREGEGATDYGTLYLTGDTGYYQQDGNLIFTGRRDHQVKIRGHRIELGDIESHLLQHGQLDEVTVLAREKDDSKYLVAYYVSDAGIQQDKLRSYLSDKLPDHMVPSFFVWLQRMPLTVNGKLDRKALPEPQLDKQEGSLVLPGTPEEKILTAIWTHVLGIEPIGITDNFFSVGGDSIKSTQIISRLRSSGYEVSVKDIFIHQTIRELALRLRRTSRMKDQSAVTGTSTLTPVQQLFFEGPVRMKHRYNQSVMLNFPAGIHSDLVKGIFTKIQEHHDALRMVFTPQPDGTISMENLPVGMAIGFREHDLRAEKDAASTLVSFCNDIQAGADLQSGPLMRLGLFHMKDGSRVLIVIHHLVVDGISWRILFEDIAILYHQLTSNQPLNLPRKTDAFISWPESLLAYTKSDQYKNAKQYWHAKSEKIIRPIPRDYEEGLGLSKYCRTEVIRLAQNTTTNLLTRSYRRYGTRINDLLLTALLLAVRQQYNVLSVQIDLEGHGREEIAAGSDISRTVGWFTSIYPVVLESRNDALPAIVKDVKESLRQIPNNGIDHGIWRYMDTSVPHPKNESQSRIIFNYLGQFDGDIQENIYVIAPETPGDEVDPEEICECDWEILGLVTNGELEMKLRYSHLQYDTGTVRRLMNVYKESLEQVIAHCCAEGKKELTPSDITYKELPATLLDELQDRYALEDVYPLSPMQEGMLFHALDDEQGGLYFEQLICRITGVLHIDAVEQTMNDIIARYTVLRTAFIHDIYKYPLQVVLQERKIHFLFKDARQEVRERGDAAIISWYRGQDRSRRFNLREDVLMRLSVLRMADNEYVLIWSYHHVLMDGWCMGIIMNDFMALYRSYSSGIPVVLPAVQPYARYISWLQHRSRNESAAYWQQYLSGYEQPATMGDGWVTPQAAADELAIERLTISHVHTGMLRKLSIRYGVTINTILQAAWGILLSKYNNTGDVVFGSVVSGRPSEIEGIEEMVGLFINTIPVRVTWKEKDSVVDLLRTMQTAALNAEPHHYHPLSEIQSLSTPGRQLLDHILVFENYPLAGTIKNAGDGDDAVQVTDVEVMVQTNYDLALVIVPGEDIVINFKYNAGRYNSQYIQRVATHFEHILEQVGDGKSTLIAEIEVISTQEKQQLLQWHGKVAEWHKKTYIELFEEQALQTPDRVAVVAGSETITYAALREKCQTIAVMINDIPDVGEIVAIYAEPSIEMIAGIFGILYSGRAFLPLDPAMNSQRQERCLQESKVELLLTQSTNQKDLHFEGRQLLIDTISVMHPVNYTPLMAAAESLAYVIYTSGSTGQPKGVKIQHSNLVNYVQWFKQMLLLAPGNQSILTSSYAFDLGYSSVFPILASGGGLHVIPASLYHTPEELLEYISVNHITYLKLTPTLFKAIIGAPSFGSQPLPDLVYILLGGEPLVPADVDIAKAAYGHLQFINHYGPTETTIGVIAQKIVNWQEYKRRPSIGRPIYNSQAFILDKDLQLLPVGVPGELCIGGDGVGGGYLNREDLTNEKFISYPPAKNGRIYRTGDLARWLPDYTIEFLGRIDKQVKIRGFRIELGEIENQLTCYPQVQDAVIVCKEKNGDKYLVAYYISEIGIRPSQLRKFLSGRLPDFMLPAHYVQLGQFPMTPNGKLNSKALPDPNVISEDRYVPARTRTEAMLVSIWSDLLHIEKEHIGIYNDFFALGAHSIIAIRLSSAIQQKCQVKISMRQIFEQPTIVQLARLIAAGNPQNAGRIRQVEKREYYPVSSAQERLFYEHCLHKDIPVYNNCTVYKIAGKLDIDKITNTFRELITRHKSLRTGFLMTTDGIVQIIHESPVFELVRLNRNNYTTVQDAFNEFVRPFDLTGNSLIRVGLLQFGEEGDMLFIDIHHIVCDGISRNVLLNDFKNIYKGNEMQPLATTYADYACWQRNLNGALEEQKEFWVQQLAGRSTRPDLPMVGNKDDAEIRYAAFRLMSIDGEIYAGIKELTKTETVSMFMFFLSAYYLLLSKVSGSTDIIIGTESTGRTQETLHNVVGTFVNILPLRMQIRPDMSFVGLLQEVKELVLAAYENQDYQYDEIVAALHERGGSDGDLIDAHFSFANTRYSTVELDELQFVPYEGLWTATNDYILSLQIAEENDRFDITFIYSKDLFDNDTIELLMDYFKSIVLAVSMDGQATIDAIEIKESVTV